MQYVPSEMERRYRLYMTGRGDSGASLFCCLRGKGEGPDAWAAHLLSRIYLLRGRIGLARSFLDLSISLFNRRGGGVPPGLGVNGALILWSRGDAAGAERSFREILRDALERQDTFVAAKAASNLAMILARTGRPGEAAPLNGLAETCYRARGYEEGVVRTELNAALIDGMSGRHGEAVDRITRILSRPAVRIMERERAAGAALLAEMFLEMDDLERAGEALKIAYASRRALERFRPVRLRLLALSVRYRLSRGERERAARLAGRLERKRTELGLGGIEYRIPRLRRAQSREAPGHSTPRRAAFDRDPVSREARAVRYAEESPRRFGAAPGSAPRTAPAGARPEILGRPFISTDPRTLRLLGEMRRAAPLPVPVLVRGETGTGKELVGGLIHAWSGRGAAPFVPVNAAALTRELFESALFGHVRGAFTGAVAERRGLLAEAGAGTLFLDEIAELDTALQAKLLRFLDSGEYLPVGSDRRRSCGARIVAATNRDLERLMDGGSFRRDLFYRLSVLAFHLPPLRARRDDIPLLVDYFLSRAAKRPGLGRLAISGEARSLLSSYDWPGNVRELEGEILRAAVRARGRVIRVGHLSAPLLECLRAGRDAAGGGLDRREPGGLPGGERARGGLDHRISAFERGEIERALQAAGGNRTEAARILGLKRTTLLYRMRRYGIETDAGPSDVD